jgi:peptidyl-prolyl cis-trans isomerase C
VFLAGFPACGGKSDKGSGKTADKSSGNQGQAVAKVGDMVITLDQFEKQINQQNPLVRSRYKSPDHKRKLLESLVEREAMVQEAKRLGLDKDPDVVQGLKKILARHLVNVEFNQKRVKQISITDEQIEQDYQENQDRYHAPEKIRVHQIFFAGASKDAKARREARKRAKEVLKKLQANPKDRRLFLKMARENSEDETTKRVGGDTNFRTKEQLVESYGKAFAETAFSLKQANDLSGIVEGDKGLYIMRLSGSQAAIDLPLDKVKGQIRTTLFARARGDAYKAYVQEVKEKVGVQVYADMVDKAKVDLEAAPQGAGLRRPGGPMPGLQGRPRAPAGKRPPKLTLPPGAKVKKPAGAKEVRKPPPKVKKPGSK